MPRPTLSQDEQDFLRAVAAAAPAGLVRVLKAGVEAIGYRQLRHALSKGAVVARMDSHEHSIRAHRQKVSADRYEQAKGLLGEMEEA